MMKRFNGFLFCGFFLVSLLGAAGDLLSQTTSKGSGEYRLHFTEGDIRRVNVTEVMRLMMHFSQVDDDAQKPSIRTSDYFWTYTFEKVLPDGSARVAATLDTFKTSIIIGEGRAAEEFFTFNSSLEYDLKHNLHDIKSLPRAQFLGQTLRFTMYPDGTVHNFENLQAYRNAAVGKGYDYDMVHAMLSLSDSLRIAQLLEFGAGGLASVGGSCQSLSTATEIPIKRSLALTSAKGNTVKIRTTYFEPPKQIDYLEGIATPLVIKTFKGGGVGEITMKDGFVSRSVYRDTANVLLGIDIDEVPEEITRTVTTTVEPVEVLRGGRVQIKETEMHRGIVKPRSGIYDDNAVEIDPATGKAKEKPQVSK